MSLPVRLSGLKYFRINKTLKHKNYTKLNGKSLKYFRINKTLKPVPVHCNPANLFEILPN